MELLLKRIARKKDYTIGKLYINGTYFCDTIEDRDRLYFGESKVMHKTAIPCGRYEVTQNVVSPKYKNRKPYKEVCDGRVPRLLNVPQFEGILMHIGNYAGHETFMKKVPFDASKPKLITEEYIEVV